VRKPAPKFKPTYADLRQIINLYEDRVKLSSIGAMYGVAGSTISCRMKMMGVPTRRSRATDARLTDIEIEKHISDYRNRSTGQKKPRFSTAKFVKGVKVAPVTPKQGRFRRHDVQLEGVRDCDHQGCMNKTRGKFCVDHALENHRARPTAPTRGSHFKDVNVVRHG